MNWQEKLRTFENNKDWERAIELMKKTVVARPNDSWAYVQAIYLFHNILLEEDYPEEKQEDLAALLKEFFELSKSKFFDNPEYLFFIGKILFIAEWYFGLNDNDQLALSFQEKAMNLEPENLLYEWAYRMSCGDDGEGYLAHQLVVNHEEKVKWLLSKGFPGDYIWGHLYMENEKYIEKL